MVVFEGCRRVRIQGVTLLNSPMFQCALSRCEDVTIDGVSVFAPNLPLNHAYNTDGIDPIGCRRVLITHCYIDTGDDCIALKASAEAGPVSDVLITDCQFRNGHGCSIGSGTSPGVRNVTVRRCTFETTETGVHIKTARDRGGVVENLFCTDLVMKRVPFPIALSCYYPGNLAPQPNQRIEAAPVTKTTPVVRDITVRNLTAELAAEAGQILGLPEMPIENLRLENIRIQADKGLRLAYVKNVTLKDAHIAVPTGEPVRKEQGVSDVHSNE
jgi:polygalacturonase